MEWLATLPDASVQHVITDPPYSDYVHTRSMRSNTATSKAKRKDRVKPSKRTLGFSSLTPELQRDVACEIARVVQRWALVFCDAESTQAWRFALQGGGFDYVRTCVWIKPNAAPQFTGDRPGAGWEAIVIAHRKGAKRWNGGGRRGVFTHAIEHGQQSGRVHGTEKPIALMLELVTLFTDHGDVIADPFAGSGTTGVACLRLGRGFLGAELDATMAATANERLLSESLDSSLSDRRAGQLALASVGAS